MWNWNGKQKASGIHIVDDVLANTERQVSSWAKLKHIAGYVLRYKGNPTQKEEPNRKVYCDKNQLDMVFIQKVELQIIRASQRRPFSDEIKLMERSKCVKKSSNIYSLDPFIDRNGLLRVGDWLNQSTMDESVEDPLLKPKASIRARLIIKWYPEKVAHSGRGITMNQIRSCGFWIINCNATIKSLISRSIAWRCLWGNLQLQKIVSVLYQGIECVKSHFLRTVVLTFLFHLSWKKGAKNWSEWNIVHLSVQLSIYIEVAKSLSTDCFLMCLRRFIGQRENVRLMISDNGTNFVADSAELTKSFIEMNHQKINQFMQDNGGEYDL